MHYLGQSARQISSNDRYRIPGDAYRKCSIVRSGGDRSPYTSEFWKGRHSFRPRNRLRAKHNYSGNKRAYTLDVSIHRLLIPWGCNFVNTMGMQFCERFLNPEADHRNYGRASIIDRKIRIDSMHKSPSGTIPTCAILCSNHRDWRQKFRVDLDLKVTYVLQFVRFAQSVRP